MSFTICDAVNDRRGWWIHNIIQGFRSETTTFASHFSTQTHVPVHFCLWVNSSFHKFFNFDFFLLDSSKLNTFSPSRLRTIPSIRRLCLPFGLLFQGKILLEMAKEQDSKNCDGNDGKKNSFSVVLWIDDPANNDFSTELRLLRDVTAYVSRVLFLTCFSQKTSSRPPQSLHRVRPHARHCLLCCWRKFGYFETPVTLETHWKMHFGTWQENNVIDRLFL